MKIIYCDSVFDRKVIEPDYEAEKNSAIKAGFGWSLISFEEVTDGNLAAALKYVKAGDSLELGIYRGWMLPPAHYQALYQGLLKKNIQLINTPEEYRHCHYLPESYDKIKGKTPKSNWTTDLTPESIATRVAEFGDHPIIVKDFVKSEKHNWEEACYIPNASDRNLVTTIVEKFVELRGDALNEGLVFRQFEALEYIAQHSKSGMPLTKEYRLFFARKQLLSLFNYWDEGEYGTAQPELAAFIEIAHTIESNFFTMDIAQKQDGEWIIMELGDGQVAGLPDNADKDDFYRNLWEKLVKAG